MNAKQRQLRLSDYLEHMPGKQLPCRGQRNATAHAPEQHLPGPGFELLDLMADRRLGQ
jgi:hypothetical protein